MISGSGRPRAAVAIALLLAMALFAPAARALHDHPDRPESECRICATSTVESAAVPTGGVVPAPSAVTGSVVAEEERRAPPPVLESGAARGPPA